MIVPTRRKLGDKFSEAARQLWLFMDGKNWDQAEMARSIAMTPGQLSKLLYGDRKAGRVWAGKLKEKLGIDTGLWDKPPAKPFTPPAARPPKPPRTAQAMHKDAGVVTPPKGSIKRKPQVRKAEAPVDPEAQAPASSRRSGATTAKRPEAQRRTA